MMMNDNIVKKVLIFGWSAFIGVIICRHMPTLRDVIVGTFAIVVAVCVGGFITISIFFLNYIDNIHQKVGDFVDKLDEIKLAVAQTSLTTLKKEIFQNMCFFTFLGISIVFLKNSPTSTFIYFIQVMSVLLIALLAFDQGKAINTCIALRELVIRRK